MAFTLRQVRYFVATAENGTVSGAARALSISQSAVTEALKDLEQDLGVALFERHARGLTITHEGHRFLRHATRILSSVADARSAFSGRGGRTGRLALGVSPLVAGYGLSDRLARYRRASPEVAVTITEESIAYLEHLLIGGELDLAIMALNEHKGFDALQSEVVDVSPYHLWLPIGHHLGSRDSITPDAVAREPLIDLSVDDVSETGYALLARQGARPNVAFRTGSVEAVRALVGTGAGVAVLPDLVYRPWSLDGDRIERRDVSGTLPVMRITVAWRRGSRLTQNAADFVALVFSGRS